MRCPRTKTVRTLARILDKQRVVQVRGTPTSGKSTLAKLLNQHYCRENVPSVYIPTWPKTGFNFYADVLVNRANRVGHSFVSLSNLEDANIVFIFGEAQMSYHDQDLARAHKISANENTGQESVSSYYTEAPLEGHPTSMKEVRSESPLTYQTYPSLRQSVYVTIERSLKLSFAADTLTPAILSLLMERLVNISSNYRTVIRGP